MPNVRVTISGIGKNFAKIQSQTIAKLAERQIEEIARETERVIKQKITERITKRDGSTGNLADSFTTVKISDGWGVGDIAYLNTNAPYWYWQNFGVAQSGRRVPPSTSEFPRNRGSFGGQAPSPGGGSARWEKGNYAIEPTQAIEAKNYIQATLNEVNQIIASVIGRTKI